MARYNNGSILVTLVATKEDLPNIEDYYNDLLVEYDKVGISININNKDTNVIMGNKTIHLYGEE